MAKFRMPTPDVAVIDPKTGQFTADFYDVMKGLERLGLLDLADVSTTAPTNGQVMIYNSTNKNFAPGSN